MTHELLISYTLLGFFSLAIGSLLNVIIYRLPMMIHTEWNSQCHALLNLPLQHNTTLNLFFPRSFCPACQHLIPAWHNIPLLSYCLLKGRCAECYQPIEWRYPLVEGLCLGLSLMAVWFFGFHVTLIFVLLFIWFLICLCFIDLKHQMLPDSLSLSLLWIGLIANTQSRFTTLPDAVLSAAGAYLTLWLFIKIFYALTGKIGMGHGDFKLFAAFGAWFGWSQLPIILLMSSMLGVIIGTVYLKKTKQERNTAIAFAGAVVSNPIPRNTTLFSGLFFAISSDSRTE